MTERQEKPEDVLSRHLPSLRSAWTSLWALLAIAVIWHVITFKPPASIGRDEETYRAYAQALGEHGWSGLREIIREWPDNPVLNEGPLPYRLFFIVPGMWVCKLMGAYSVANMALLSSLFGLGFIVVALVLLRRWFGPVYGFLIALLLVFSPLASALSRRGLQDTCFAFVATATVLVFDRCWRQRRRLDVWLLGLVLLAGFLTKETMVFLYPGFVLAGFCYARSGERFNTLVVLPFILAPLMCLAVVSWVSGDLSTALRTYRFYATMQEQIPYALKFQAGPWFRYGVDLTLLSPLAVLLALIGASSSRSDQSHARGTNLAFSYLLAGLAVFSLLPIVNVRLVLFLEPYILAFTSIGVLSIATRLFTTIRFQLAAVALLTALVLWSEVAQFDSIFNKADVYDPVTATLIKAAGFVR